MSGYTVKVYSEQSSEQEKVGIVHWKDKKWKLYRNNLALLLHLWFSIIIYIYIYYYTYYNLKNSQDFRFNYYRSLWSFNVFILSRVFLNVYRIREIKVKKKKEKITRIYLIILSWKQVRDKMGTQEELRSLDTSGDLNGLTSYKVLYNLPMCSIC